MITHELNTKIKIVTIKVTFRIQHSFIFPMIAYYQTPLYHLALQQSTRVTVTLGWTLRPCVGCSHQTHLENMFSNF